MQPTAFKTSNDHACIRLCFDGPSLLTLFQKIYSQQSICYFNMDGDVQLLEASEGARMGCKLSSFAFALTVQDVYEDIDSALGKDGSCMKAATDCILMLRVKSKAENLRESSSPMSATQ